VNDAQRLEAKLPISEATRKRNPHLYPAAAGMGAVAADRAEPAPLRPLVQGKQERKARKRGVGGRAHLRVCIVQFRRRTLDPDAVAAACKPLTDAVATSLGVDDADPRVEWEWSQVKTAGEEGVLVKITEIL
jgi:hypothetical protein